MEATENLFQTVDTSQWPTWVAIVADIAMATVCVAFLSVIGYFALARGEISLPSVLWLLAVFLACSAIHHVANAVLADHAPRLWPELLKLFIGVCAWLLFIATLKWLPRWSAVGLLVKSKTELEREVGQLRMSESSLHERVIELERINAELEYVSRGVVGREERILELKREINHLLVRVGEQPRYRAAMELPA